VLKNLKPKENEDEKAWFIEIDKVFQEKNLKIFYLPLISLKKLLISQQFSKLPDPKDYFIGLTYLSSNIKQHDTKDKAYNTATDENILIEPKTVVK